MAIPWLQTFWWLGAVSQIGQQRQQQPKPSSNVTPPAFSSSPSQITNTNSFVDQTQNNPEKFIDKQTMKSMLQDVVSQWKDPDEFGNYILSQWYKVEWYDDWAMDQANGAYWSNKQQWMQPEMEEEPKDDRSFLRRSFDAFLSPFKQLSEWAIWLLDKMNPTNSIEIDRAFEAEYWRKPSFYSSEDQKLREEIANNMKKEWNLMLSDKQEKVIDEVYKNVFWEDFNRQDDTAKNQRSQLRTALIQWGDLEQFETSTIDDLTKIAMWTAWGIATSVAPVAAWWFATAGETQLWQAVLQPLWQWLEVAWSYINMMPWLSQYRDSLSPEVQKEFDQFVWWSILALWLWAKLRNPKTGKIDVKTIASNLKPSEVLNNFQNNVLDLSDWKIPQWTVAWELVTQAGNIGRSLPTKQIIDRVKSIPWVTRKTLNAMTSSWPVPTVDDVAARITQATKSEDIKRAAEWLKVLDLEWVSTYKDLASNVSNKKKAISDQVTNLLWTDTRTFKPSDLEKTTTVGKQKVASNFVNDAIRDLDALYEKVGNAQKLAEIRDLKDRFDTNWLSLQELNNLSKEYWINRKWFSESGKELRSVSAQWFENIRSWIKDIVRERMPSNAPKELDRQYYNLVKVEELADKMSERAQRIENTIKKPWLGERLWWLLWQWLDLATFWWARWLINNFVPSQRWAKRMDAADIESNLAKSIKEYDKLINKIESIDTSSNKWVSRLWNLLNNASKKWFLWLWDRAQQASDAVWLWESVNTAKPQLFDQETIQTETVETPTRQQVASMQANTNLWEWNNVDLPESVISMMTSDDLDRLIAWEITKQDVLNEKLGW